MSSILVSWLAFHEDFESKGERKEVFLENGPNGQIHKESLQHYDEHRILVNWEETTDNIQLEYKIANLRRYIRESGLSQKVTLTFVPLKNPSNLNEILSAVERFLGSIEGQIEIFISPGTPAMQTAWYLLGGTHPHIRLFQTVRPNLRSHPGDPREYVALDKTI